MRVVLANVTAIVTQQGQPNGIGGAATASGPELGAADAQLPQGGSRESAGRPVEGSVDSEDADAADKPPAMTVEELDGVRAREITAKAVSGMLLLLLKWFKISRKTFHVSRQLFLVSMRGKLTRTVDRKTCSSLNSWRNSYLIRIICL
jgi:hypothetical protein